MPPTPPSIFSVSTKGIEIPVKNTESASVDRVAFLRPEQYRCLFVIQISKADTVLSATLVKQAASLNQTNLKLPGSFASRTGIGSGRGTRTVRPAQGNGAIAPSRSSTMSRTTMSDGRLRRVYPPPTPRLLVRPSFRRCNKICSRIDGDVPSLGQLLDLMNFLFPILSD